MRMTDAIRMYLRDMRAEGRLTSRGSEAAYARTLELHAEDVGNRDPRTTGREDVKRTLGRWENPNTRGNRRAILVSFYRWTVEEGYRPYNPAEQTRRPKRRPSEVYRLSLEEVHALMATAEPGLEERAIYLGLCAGARRQELLGLQREHLTRRPGFVWISPDIAKGGRERYVPVIADLAPLVEQLVAELDDGHYVLCGQIAGLAGKKMTRIRRMVPTRPMSFTALYDMVVDVGQRAGIAAPIHPHLLRHAFCDHVTRLYGLRVAQYLMGHADPSTTAGYTGAPTLDELRAIVEHTSFATPSQMGPESQQYRHGDSNPGSNGAAVVGHDGETTEEER